MKMAPPVMETTGQLDRGIWYRLLDGEMYAARWIADRAIELTALDPNTLEPFGAPRGIFDETFFANYCRKSALGEA